MQSGIVMEQDDRYKKNQSRFPCSLAHRQEGRHIYRGGGEGEKVRDPRVKVIRDILSRFAKQGDTEQG